MRTNGFALYTGPEGRLLAEGASARVQRSCERVVVSPEPELGGYTVAYSLDRSRGMPLVHGFIDAGPMGEEIGEYALLARKAEAVVASRDKLGTRGLYVWEGGSCVATDHRFLRGRPTLVPSGATLSVGSTQQTTSALVTPPVALGFDECASRVADLLGEAVARRVRGKKRVAVSFSGGLDSSLIARLAAREAEVVLCSVFTSGSRDQSQVGRAADQLGLELRTVELDADAAALEVGSLDLPFEPTPMDRALWCIYSASAREAAANGCELIMLGQLADELFGGYMKYARTAQKNREEAAALMRADVLASGERAFIRDEEACARFTEARFPFADEHLAAFALGIPLEFKVRDGERKSVLRRAATILGLPDALASAPKKAAQYSSGVGKLFA